MDRKTLAKIVVFWLIPLIFSFIYIASEALVGGRGFHLGFVSRTVYLSLASSVIWVPAGYIFTIVFGGLAVEFLLKLFAHEKLLKRTLVAPTEKELKKLSAERRRVEVSAKTISKIFGLVFAVNFIYVLFLLSRGWITESASPYTVFIRVEILAGMLFLPLLTLILPILVGNVRVRQVDNSPIGSYWLSLIIGIAGGIGIFAFLLQGSTLVSIIPPAFLFAVCSWYAALGVMLALPTAQRMFITRLLRMRRHKGVIFGKIWAGTSKAKAREV